MSNYSKIICFCSGTEIITPNGNKYIEHIKPKDIVISYNQNLGITEEIKVERIASSKHSMITKITFKNKNSVKSTIDHPFWVVGKGWCSIAPATANENYDLQVNQLLVDDKCIFFDNFDIDCGIVGIAFGVYDMKSNLVDACP